MRKCVVIAQTYHRLCTYGEWAVSFIGRHQLLAEISFSKSSSGKRCSMNMPHFSWAYVRLFDMRTCIEYLESVACPLEDHFTTFKRSSTSYHIDYVILFYNTFHWRIKILWVRLSYSNSYLALLPTLGRPDSKRHWAATPLLLLPLVSLISRSERLVASQTLMLVNFLKKILCHTMFSFVLFCG